MGVIPRLRRMSVQDTIKVWRNAIKLIASPEKAKFHSAARKVLAAASAEWQRRTIANPDDYFKWPSTEALGGDGTLRGKDWPDEGLLKFMRYTVGRTHGEAPQIRQQLLSETFRGHLPPVVSLEYMREWGTPSSASRLRKIAECIASFARNAKRRRNASLGDAIRDWERDLAFLHDKYYVDHFGFAWPSPAL